jgi:metal-responsive CopG/Arc/MetJ family transcriptional regulator
MRKSISVTPKKRGRPATGRDPLITVRLPPELIEEIAEEAARLKLGRSQVIREAIQKGLGKIRRRKER